MLLLLLLLQEGEECGCICSGGGLERSVSSGREGQGSSPGQGEVEG